MPTIKVNTNALHTYETDLQNIQGRVAVIMDQFDSIKNNLDWDIRAASGINSRLKGISRELSCEKAGIGGMKKFLNSARTKYDLLENQNKYRKGAIVAAIALGQVCSKTGNVEPTWLPDFCGTFDKVGAAAKVLKPDMEVISAEIGTIVSAYDLINKTYKEEIPKGLRKVTKKTIKYLIKKSGAKGVGKIFDVKSVIDDIIDQKYFDTVEDLMGLFDVKGWDFSGVELTADPRPYLDQGMNVGVLKVQAVIKSFKMCMDKNGYIQKNDAKYMNEAENRILSGDIAGGIAALPADFIQTVGKGSVDVVCQVASSSIDSIFKAYTGGLMDLSTLNAMCEDAFGHSMGTLFNSATSAISKGVDFYTDKILIEGSSLVGKGIGKAVKAGISGVKSGLKFLKSVF